MKRIIEWSLNNPPPPYARFADDLAVHELIGGTFFLDF
jgi:hypothetical protein